MTLGNDAREGRQGQPALLHARLPDRPPEPGELVRVRSRQWLVEAVEEPGGSPVVRLACADDDAQGQTLAVFWDCELDRQILHDEGWNALGERGFDDPRRFAAFFHTLRWNCVTATDPRLIQSPFRAGIRLDAYQMEPLRKALRLPRVNLFIADDTGLGKTVEAGLIARELLLRKKARTIVVAAPPSVLEQWKGEMEERFGLVFEVLDRAYVSRMRRERGFGVNPWRTHSRFLVSHRLLADPAYTDPMREWLGPMSPGSLLILDEAHHAAPSSGGRYGIETKFTRAVRDLAGRFEHRLFLSATPHNGHSNSFATLLELLDPYRFTRGVKVRGRRVLDDVMVRRLKEDIRQVQGGFPKRNVVRIEIDGLPEDAPEIALSRLLDEYRTAREVRHAGAPKGARAAAGLLVVGLQQRLLSSVEAFARSLKVHRVTVLRHWEKGRAASGGDSAESGAQAAKSGAQAAEAAVAGQPDAEPISAAQAHGRTSSTGLNLFLAPPDADDERAEWDEADADAEEAAQIEAITLAAEAGAGANAKPTLADQEAAQWANEQRLLDEMEQIAEDARYQPDAKTLRLIDWIRANQCPDLPPFGEASPTDAPGLALDEPSVADAAPKWNNRRVLIFTENRQGTKRYLREVLGGAVCNTDRGEERIEVIDGHTSGARRREVQRRFNARPEDDPLRILIATDAAREGLNFQAHCTDLFHFDLPWNPGRIEQRNGRIDRKLQPAPEVNCHYFVLPQRFEDRVLEVLVEKTKTIQRELGSLSKVIDDDVERRMSKAGIRRRDAEALRAEIEGADMDASRKRAAMEELEDARDRQDALADQIEGCQSLLARSRAWVGFEAEPFRQALSCALEMMCAPPLAEGRDEDGRPVWTFPPLGRHALTDPSWTATLDSLRAPMKMGQKLAEWRRDAPIRPVVFEDAGVLSDETVHLHLDQRIAQRLLARFRAQGFVSFDLSRACLAQARDSTPRVVLLGRLCLYGQRAERLHEVLVAVAARWTDPNRRAAPLRAYARDAEARSMELLNETLETGARLPNETIRRRLSAAVPRDITELKPQLEERADELARVAVRRLAERGEAERRDLRETLQRQRERVAEELAKHEDGQSQLALGLDPAEARQLDADVRHWRRRLDQFDLDLAEEPDRVREFYKVRARRVEPVGLVYLWPESN